MFVNTAVAEKAKDRVLECLGSLDCRFEHLQSSRVKLDAFSLILKHLHRSLLLRLVLPEVRSVDKLRVNDVSLEAKGTV